MLWTQEKDARAPDATYHETVVQQSGGPVSSRSEGKSLQEGLKQTSRSLKSEKLPSLPGQNVICCKSKGFYTTRGEWELEEL